MNARRVTRRGCAHVCILRHCLQQQGLAFKVFYCIDPSKMAFPQPSGLLPTEVVFLYEMEQVTVIPGQRLDRLDLLGILV